LKVILLNRLPQILKNTFNENCSAKGPSITPEQFEQVQYAKQCGSKIPLFHG